jgi:hypothetical protein
MTERTNHTIITVIIVLAIIVCVSLLLRFPISFSSYNNPAAAASFSTYNTNPNQPYNQSFNAYPNGYNGYGVQYPTSYSGYPSTTYTYPTRVITSFTDCANAGYPIIQTYPEQCSVPGGQTFTQGTTTTTTQTQYQYQYTNPTD